MASSQDSAGARTASKFTLCLLGRTKFFLGYLTTGLSWLLEAALSFLTRLPLRITFAFIQVGMQEGGRRWERQRMRKMKVTVFYELILEGLSHHVLHTLLVRKQVK